MGEFLLNALTFVCIGNAILYVLFSFALGGQAGSGKIECGRYFIRLNAFMAYREVNRGVYAYSLWHGRSAFVGVAAAIVASLAR